jgi:xanthine permease XanP
MRTRPRDLIYAVDERPPPVALVVLGLQHCSTMLVSLLLPLIVAKAAGVPDEVLPSLLSLSMVALALATLLQAFSAKGLGAGYLIPGFCSSNYLSCSVSAAQAGGMPLVYGMTVIAGLFEAALSRFLMRLRPYFPPEVSGLAVFIIGIDLGVLSARNLFGVDHPDSPRGIGLAIGLGTFALGFVLSIYGKGPLRLFCALIAVVAGYLAAVTAGLMPDRSVALLQQAAMVDLPSTGHIGFDFDPVHIFPFVLAAIAATLKTIGAVTTCQKINDSQWTRPDMAEIKRGVSADGVASVLAGLLGSTGQNSSTSNIGISTATGATSRWIALPIAGWLLLMACSPKLAAIFVSMPYPVVGGSLLFAASFIMVNGLQILMSRMLDARRTAIIGLSLALAVSRYAFPDFFTSLPEVMQPLVASALSLGMLSALGLNLVFRFGIRQRETLSHRIDEGTVDPVYGFLERCGGVWGARAEVMRRATQSTVEVFETIARYSAPDQPVLITAHFDEFSVDVEIRYQGRAMQIPAAAPTAEEMFENPDLALDLGLVLVNRLADRVRVTSLSENEHALRLHFQH